MECVIRNEINEINDYGFLEIADLDIYPDKNNDRYLVRFTTNCDLLEWEVPVKIQDGKLYISDDYFHELLEPIWFIKYLFGQAANELIRIRD